MTRLSPCSDFSAATAGASRLHAGHQGAQNHSSTSLPAVAARSNCCPSSNSPSSSKISARVSAAAAAVVALAAAEVAAGVAALVGAGASVGVAALGSVALGCCEVAASSLPQPARTPTAISPATKTEAARDIRRVIPPSLTLARQTIMRVAASYIRLGEHPDADRFGFRHWSVDLGGVRGPGAAVAVMR